jgi:membrane-associated phospholipid phosphatase
VLTSARSSAAKQMASVAVAAVLVGLIGLARVYLGVHSVSDVVLGFAAGAVWLGACIVAYPRLVAIGGTVATTPAATLQPMTR